MSSRRSSCAAMSSENSNAGETLVAECKKKCYVPVLQIGECEHRPCPAGDPVSLRTLPKNSSCPKNTHPVPVGDPGSPRNHGMQSRARKGIKNSWLYSRQPSGGKVVAKMAMIVML